MQEGLNANSPWSIVIRNCIVSHMSAGCGKPYPISIRSFSYRNNHVVSVDVVLGLSEYRLFRSKLKKCPFASNLLALLNHHWTVALERNKKALAISFYVAKALDSVAIDGICLDPKSIKDGVPQRCILCPTLFMLHMNDLLKIVNVCCYANDSTIDALCSGYTNISRNGIGNPEDAQVVLENCFQKDVVYKFLRYWLGEGLFVAPVDIWKTHRRILLPVFHNRVVEEYISVITEQTAALVRQLEERVDKGEFDILKYISSCTIDIMFETAMGERMDVQHSPDTEYLRARHTVMTIINMRMYKVWLQPEFLFKLTPYAKLQKDNIELTHKFTDEVVKKKRIEYECNKHQMDSHEVKNKDGKLRSALDLLFGREIEFTDEQLREHIDSITIAGNDTTALVIAYTLVLLGIHQDAQEKIYKEQEEIFGDSLRGAGKEDIQKMQFMERVLKESMRLYTVVPIIARHVDKDIYLPHCGVTIPAGAGAVVCTLGVHRNKRIWGTNVDEFDPDRFLPERSADRHPAAFLGFSYGGRNCIVYSLQSSTTERERIRARGERLYGGEANIVRHADYEANFVWSFCRHFGMIIMKTILSSIIRSYKIYAEDVGKLKLEMLLFPVRGHQVRIERRFKL
ncbi:Cytochrome P450 4c3 [Eumeta japonica]|uniref:Cytochrome P450 4c3 n=1 Tax=Eumeta variegata TaxID=151549 RepID=A0A4C1TRX0_EUMVA|nr:Cytochrome P450 4c3 [Eumeta japonica]